MFAFGIFSLFFGMVVVLNPDIIAYLIGFFFIFVGLNILTVSWMAKKANQSSEKKWEFGGYELIRKRK